MDESVIIIAFYRFVSLVNPSSMQKPLQIFCDELDLKGTILLAQEGINGTVSGSRLGIDNLIAYLESQAVFDHLEYKESRADFQPFNRMKVRLKKEIVTIGIPKVDPLCGVGTYVAPEDWNELITQEGVIIIDTRNEYEVAVGTFKNAVNPQTRSFRSFPEYVKSELKDKKNQPIAMFCTGGIRCEKSTAYLIEQGFQKVYHLKGGILKYLERVPKEQSLWEGECFVFDQRVTVNHELKQGDYTQCFACRHPLSEEDRKSEDYLPGISCSYCIEDQTEEKRDRMEMRQKQIALAANKNR